MDLERNTGEAILQKGWPEFAACYSISIGHVILFKYEGNSQFHVTILDNSCTEIEYPMSASHNEQANRSGGFRKRKEQALITSKEGRKIKGTGNSHSTCNLKRRGGTGRDSSSSNFSKFTNLSSYFFKTSDTNEAGTAGIEKPDTVIPSQANGIRHKRIKPVKVEADLDDPIPRVITGKRATTPLHFFCSHA